MILQKTSNILILEDFSFIKNFIFDLSSEFHICFASPLAPRKKSLSGVSLDPDGVNVEVGDQVLVAGQKQGIVRFFGKTDFAPGMSI